MASSKQRAVTDVPLEGWVRFGRILQDWREDVLGYKTRAEFVRATGINLRLAQELENSPAYRAGTYTKWALEDAEKAYQVTRESMMAVLRGHADTFVRAEHAPAEQDADPGFFPRQLPPSPFADPGRNAADHPYARVIWELILDLPRRITDPGAAHLGLAGDDAKVWNGTGDLPLGDRVWVLADMRRRADGRASGRNPGTGTAGALTSQLVRGSAAYVPFTRDTCHGYLA